MGSLDKAIADYDAALRIRPKHANSLYGRGVAKRQKGDEAGGEADFAEAQAIRPSIVDEMSRYGVK